MRVSRNKKDQLCSKQAHLKTAITTRHIIIIQTFNRRSGTRNVRRRILVTLAGEGEGRDRASKILKHESIKSCEKWIKWIAYVMAGGAEHAYTKTERQTHKDMTVTKSGRRNENMERALVFGTSCAVHSLA